jgi:hypothetical protein
MTSVSEHPNSNREGKNIGLPVRSVERVTSGRAGETLLNHPLGVPETTRFGHFCHMWDRFTVRWHGTSQILNL